ncbi:MAG: leucine-rich repeat protein [Eubacteriales bacterium]|nr:leucine-rich repeat protein [Eubacteriales bacterium]
MRNSSQLLMVALAAVFAVALCLTIALICLGNSRKEEPETDPPGRTRYYIPGSGTSYEEPDDTVVTTLEIDIRGGMVFRTNGNGTCALESIGDCREAFAVIPETSPSGDRVTGISARAFYGCDTVAAIQIPAGVTVIGELAFADCPNLVYISVSEQNPRFCDVDGVLYSADGSELILYPAKHAGTTATVPATVRRIAEMAFYQCAYLDEIRFTGSPAQWEDIRIGGKNYSLTAAAVAFYALPSGK